ncbi:MAG: tRNA (adenosine(37)-N6)-threonylcarbamoyltransferase complex dimerization subunit type 1 TsaB [Candidatus Magnetomorum sp.]|nr:tRNA (adenosine(37)-N6)-threonylcarbamoyltransferase complex dimerization subunit type 1 TsaB [Candidatus Magnetomorum sp.]
MIILAIDMSGNRCSIGISQKQSILAESSTFVKMRHLPGIMPQLDYTLKQANKRIQDIELLCAVSGPGSWTGIRIAVTMLKTFAHALSIPCVTVNSLDILACNMRFVEPVVYPIIDAARKQVYSAAYDCQSDSPQNIEIPTLKKMDIFLAHIQSPAILVGDTIHVYSDKIQSMTKKQLLLAPVSLNQILISHVIEKGYNKFVKNGPDELHDISPNYLQQTDAERNFVKM